MNKKTGLYISTEGKNIYRTVYSMRGEAIIPPTTVEEEIISISELELGGYIKVLDEMLEPCFPQRLLFTTFDDVYETFCSLLKIIEDFSALIRMEVFKNMPADDCSEEYYLSNRRLNLALIRKK